MTLTDQIDEAIALYREAMASGDTSTGIAALQLSTQLIKLARVIEIEEGKTMTELPPSAPVTIPRATETAPRFEDVQRILGDQRTCVSIPVSQLGQGLSSQG